MDILKVKILLCFLHMPEEDLSVTNLGVTLKEEKYVISRCFSAMEKDGILDRSNRRCPKLTTIGQGMAQQYGYKVEGVLNHLLNAGVPQEDAREDAIVMAVYCKDATFARLRLQGMSSKIKLSFHEGMRFDGSRLCRSYKEGCEPLTFLICQEQLVGENNISEWNDRFENPCKLKVHHMKGNVLLRSLRGSRDYSFSYWNGTKWRSMERQGSVLSFPADYLNFQSIGKDEGRMLYGKILIRAEQEGKEERMLFTTYIA